MAVINVNPTRMELTKLKKKLATARKGHRLLKDKRDELMRRFMEMIRQNRELRREVEDAIMSTNTKMALARSVVSDKVLDTALMLPKQEMTIDISTQNVMSVNIPVYDIKYRTQNPDDIYCYGYVYTSADMDDALHALAGVLPKMLRLAEVEKSCKLMAAEIEKTRRRVNALEHVMIPRYEETIRYITMKLEENERSTITRLMKVKNMVMSNSRSDS